MALSTQDTALATEEEEENARAFPVTRMVPHPRYTFGQNPFSHFHVPHHLKYHTADEW